jgi:hypothetical protein
VSNLADTPLPIEELPALTRAELVSLANRLLRLRPQVPEWMGDEIREVAATAEVVAADWWDEGYRCGCLAGTVLHNHGIENGYPDLAHTLMTLEQRIAVRGLGVDFYHKLQPDGEVGVGVYRIIEDKAVGS